MPHPSRRAHHAVALCALALSAAVLVGCHPEGNSAPASTGSLAVTITVPNGIAAAVAITGPNGYATTLPATHTLQGLTPGVYTVVADSAMGPDSVVGTLTDTGTVTGSPATVVVSGTATANVSYALENRVGGLWFTNNSSPTIREYSGAQLRASAAPVPAETLATASGSSGLALDAGGNMWESRFTSDTLLMYTTAARYAGGATAPSNMMVGVGIPNAEDLAVDAAGNLWVASCHVGVAEFTPTQLAAGGSQPPAVMITGSLLVCPFSMAFDARGNLWVSDYLSNHLVKYSAAQLAVTGAPTPIDTIGAVAGSLNHPAGIAFDSSGNLWVANRTSSMVVDYTPGQLAASGAPVPHTSISLPAGTGLFGAAFDHRGTLWVTDGSHGLVYGLMAAQLAESGAPVPAVTIDGSGLAGSFAPEQPMFDPNAPAVGLLTNRVRTTAPLKRRARVAIRNPT